MALKPRCSRAFASSTDRHVPSSAVVAAGVGDAGGELDVELSAGSEAPPEHAKSATSIPEPTIMRIRCIGASSLSTLATEQARSPRHTYVAPANPLQV